MDSLARAVSRECGSGSYYLLEAPTLEGDPVELTVTRRGKLQVSGQFDPRCLRDALEIAGSGARLCLGFPPRPSSAPSLLVEPGERRPHHPHCRPQTAIWAGGYFIRGWVLPGRRL